jgi:hypothetical protein
VLSLILLAGFLCYIVFYKIVWKKIRTKRRVNE